MSPAGMKRRLMTCASISGLLYGIIKRNINRSLWIQRKADDKKAELTKGESRYDKDRGL